MNADKFNAEIYQPAIAVASDIMGLPRSYNADRMLLTIAGQESAWKHRYQVINKPGVKGPARGFWQFERGGGVMGVMNHPRTAIQALTLSRSRGIPFVRDELWQMLETDDVLAAGFARLLLWSDSRPLPIDEHAGWHYYLNNWRPGKPHPGKWRGLWEEAEAALAVGDYDTELKEDVSMFEGVRRERDLSPREIQIALNNEMGIGLLVDGIIGSQTISAIKNFQAAHGLEPDGIVGPKTLDALRGIA